MPKLSLRSRTRPCLSSGTNWPTRSSGYPDRRGAVSERLKKEAHREVGEEGAGTPRNSTRVTEAGGTTAPFLLELLFGGGGNGGNTPHTVHFGPCKRLFWPPCCHQIPARAHVTPELQSGRCYGRGKLECRPFKFQTPRLLPPHSLGLEKATPTRPILEPIGSLWKNLWAELRDDRSSVLRAL